MFKKRSKTDKVKPTFFIPGAGKSGTSYLADALKRHPDIFIPEIKEPSYFATWPAYGRYDLGESYYWKHFINYNGEKHVGEASTVYMFDPSSPGLIKKHIGTPKLIFLVRHPVDRVYSNYWQEMKYGRILPTFKDFLKARGARVREMIYVSRYDKHLANYLEVFNRKDILVVLYDDLRSDAGSLLDQVTSFLKLPPLCQDIDTQRQVNPPSRARFSQLNHLINNRRVNETIRSIIPANWIVPLKRAKDGANRLLQKSFLYEPMDAESRSILLDELTVVTNFLEREFSFQLDLWRS